MIKREYAAGGFKYTLNGKLHQPNGPAFVGDYNSEPWYLFGRCHRYYGPAVIRRNGGFTWFIHGSSIK
jgi:hypothetical protein